MGPRRFDISCQSDNIETGVEMPGNDTRHRLHRNRDRRGMRAPCHTTTQTRRCSTPTTMPPRPPGARRPIPAGGFKRLDVRPDLRCASAEPAQVVLHVDRVGLVGRWTCPHLYGGGIVVLQTMPTTSRRRVRTIASTAAALTSAPPPGACCSGRLPAPSAPSDWVRYNAGRHSEDFSELDELESCRLRANST